MGTRAAFFVGNPCDVEGRRWLGCVAYDGYPSRDVGKFLRRVKTERGFANAVRRLLATRNDATHPEKGMGWPFPWEHDVFVTDCTYAYFDDQVQLTWFHRGFRPLSFYLRGEDRGAAEDELPRNVSAPAKYDRRSPDSIMLLRVALS